MTWVLAAMTAVVMPSSLGAGQQPSAALLRDVQVTAHHFATAVSGTKYMLSINDTQASRYLVLQVSAMGAVNPTKLFCTDFTIAYTPIGGSETRSRCEGIAASANDMVIGAGWVTLDSSTKASLRLVFAIETNVDTVNLYRIGVAEPIPYRIGTDRPVSVHVFSSKGSDQLSKAVSLIRSGGYTIVSAADTLVPEITDVTIHYREKAEVQAREISQRLMVGLKVVPAVKRLELVTDVDVIVWLGKER
jgi:hypothetical protein